MALEADETLNSELKKLKAQVVLLAIAPLSDKLEEDHVEFEINCPCIVVDFVNSEQTDRVNTC